MISLSGPLGVGKTVFAKGLAEGMGVDPAVVASPTFVIGCEYPTATRGLFVHVDLYRVESRDELDAAGFVDWLDPSNLVAVEWGDRFPAALPADRLEISIQRTEWAEAEADRVIHALSSGPDSAAVLERWRAAPTARAPERLYRR